MKDAASAHQKLFKKGRKSTKHVELYERLWKTFKDARTRGISVNFHWLWSKARVIQSELDEKQPIKKHVIVRFLQKYQIRMRAKQRNKKKSKSQKVPELKKWHATYREECIRTNFEDPSYDQKWGNFKPDERINVDQSPLPFVVNSKKTHEFITPGEGASHNTWISQPGSGLDKRQCSLQVAFRYKGEQPRLAVIFRGKGKRITQDEKLAWHPDIDVYFQPNAWMDSNVNMQWTEKTLKSFVEQQKLKKYVLLRDNLEAHCTEEFKVAVRDQKGLVWYGLAGGTDLWQPVDAGYAQVLKTLISREHQDWLDRDDNADRWFQNEKPYTAMERRILITNWAGEAWKKLSKPEYDNLRKSCWVKTGCLLTDDGSDDNLVKPEGLDGCEVPPPSFCDPNSSTPSSNNPPEIQIINDEQAANACLPEDELVEPDDAEAEEERIFDIIDGFLLD